MLKSPSVAYRDEPLRGAFVPFGRDARVWLEERARSSPYDDTINPHWFEVARVAANVLTTCARHPRLFALFEWLARRLPLESNRNR